WMARHLVTMVGTYDPMDGQGNVTASEHLYCFPGFVVELLGQSYWVTAGHNFNDFFGEYTRKGYVRPKSYSFMDYFGPDAAVKQQMPFSFPDEPSFHIEEPQYGVDIGLMPLRYLFAENFKANGIVPFERKNWVGTEAMEVDFYAMLRTPTELMQPLAIPGSQISKFGAPINVQFVFIHETEKLPDYIDEPGNYWMAGRVFVDFSIEGMSGSPVFGFRKNVNGQWEYRLVGLQSRWL